MKLIKQLYSFVIFIQIVLTFLFILENVNNLDEIEYSFAIGEDEFSFTLNIYTALLVIAIVCGIVMLASINVFGGGLNTEGTKTLSKFVSMIALLGVLSLGTSYYLLSITTIGLIMNLFIIMVYVLQAFNMLANDDSTEVDE